MAGHCVLSTEGPVHETLQMDEVKRWKGASVSRRQRWKGEKVKR